MKYLIEGKEKEAVFRLPCELNFCPILNEMGSGDEREKNPDVTLTEIRPGKKN